MGCRDVIFAILLTFVELVISLQICKFCITISKRFSFYYIENEMCFLCSFIMFLQKSFRYHNEQKRSFVAIVSMVASVWLGEMRHIIA